MKLKPHKPIREKYNPTPSAKEKRFHLWMMQLPCEACLVEPCGVFHHLLSETPDKRFRRDHELGLPLCNECHMELHRSGDEQKWCTAVLIDPVAQAMLYRLIGRQKGYL